MVAADPWHTWWVYPLGLFVALAYFVPALRGMRMWQVIAIGLPVQIAALALAHFIGGS